MDLVRRGQSGLAVGRVQQALLESGYAVPHPELIAATFGAGTLAAVRAFQASHLGPRHRPLAEDGIVGEETWWALQHPGGHREMFVAEDWRCDISRVRDAVKPVIDAALGEIGVREEPDASNDGPDVRKYTEPKFVGSAWCILFVSWCFQHLPGGSPFGRIASTWALYEWAEARGLVLPAAAIPQPGDAFVILRGERHDPNHRGHGGIICDRLDDGRLCTVEGNSSNAVRGCVRDRSQVSALLRPVRLV